MSTTTNISNSKPDKPGRAATRQVGDSEQAEPPSSAGSDDPDQSAATPSGNRIVEINCLADDADEQLEAQLAACFARVLDAAGIATGRFSIAVVADEQMAALHERHKGVTGTTDVLTFDLRTAGDEPPDGEIIICIDEAGRQARQRGHAVGNELLLYLVHGLMHQLGYDDGSQDSAREMHQREDELLMQIGIGPVYDKNRIAENPSG